MSSPIRDIGGRLEIFMRAGAGHREKGRYIEGTPTTFKAYASIQPLTQREVLLLPEGTRDRETRKIYCEKELLGANEKTQTTGDTWTDKSGNVFVVFGVEPWDIGDLPHWKGFLYKRQALPEAP